MNSICFYFQAHQPFRIRKYRIFDIGNHEYFDEKMNRQYLQRICEKCYVPATEMMLELLKKYKNFKVSFSFSGTLLEQLETYFPHVLKLFRKVVETGKVEMLGETYYHSLASIFSKREFERQIMMHKKKIKEVFSFSPRVFRNTELVYNNDIASVAAELDFKAILAEGADHVLAWRSPNFVYKTAGKDIKLLLKNYRLSDDIAFRFSSREWKEFPLTAEKFSSWLNSCDGNVNLFFDYETFGEHQWKETGIFEFFSKLIEIMKEKNFLMPSDLAEQVAVAQLDIPFVISWADIERDLSAWLGNEMQQAASKKIYEMEENVISTGDEKLIDDWGKLQTSDHFYYMCTKWFADGDVHKYFNPYESPYKAFISYMNILNDLALRIKK